MNSQENRPYSDEIHLFQCEIENVKPLKKEPRNLQHLSPLSNKIRTTARRISAESSLVDTNPLTTQLHTQSENKRYNPLDLISWVQAGIQSGVYKKFRLGQYQITNTIDIRNLTNKQARNAFYNFIQQSYAQGNRCLLLIHGTNLKSTPPGRLKLFTEQWCKEIDEIVAYHSAQQKHGGTGASYILLKKNHTLHYKYKPH